MRTLLAAVAITVMSCSASSACQDEIAVAEPAPEPHHIHTRTEPGFSCDEICLPGICAKAWSVTTQKPALCTSAEDALCICHLPTGS